MTFYTLVPSCSLLKDSAMVSSSSITSRWDNECTLGLCMVSGRDLHLGAASAWAAAESAASHRASLRGCSCFSCARGPATDYIECRQQTASGATTGQGRQDMGRCATQPAQYIVSCMLQLLAMGKTTGAASTPGLRSLLMDFSSARRNACWLAGGMAARLPRTWSPRAAPAGADAAAAGPGSAAPRCARVLLRDPRRRCSFSEALLLCCCSIHSQVSQHCAPLRPVWGERVPCITQAVIRGGC